MSSEKRVSANRVNCLYSTGPRTDKGKLRSSRNALKHGLTAKTDVIPGDPYRSYKSYRRNLLAELNPSSFLDHELADRIIGDLWRLKRIPKLESAIFREMRMRKNQPALALAELALAVATKDRNFTDTCDFPAGGTSRLGGEPARRSRVCERSEQERSPQTTTYPAPVSPRGKPSSRKTRYCTPFTKGGRGDFSVSADSCPSSLLKSQASSLSSRGSSRDKGSRASSASLSRSAPADKLVRSHTSTGWLDYSEQFSRFSRYESSLERSLFRCLKEYSTCRVRREPSLLGREPSLLGLSMQADEAAWRS